MYAEDQRREWAAKDKKKKEQEKARAQLLDEVIKIRGEQVKRNQSRKEEEDNVLRKEGKIILENVQNFHE